MIPLSYLPRAKSWRIVRKAAPKMGAGKKPIAPKGGGPKNSLPPTQGPNAGKPCKPGMSAARTGCIPKTKPGPKNSLPATQAAAGEKPGKPAAAKKPKQTAADRVFIANHALKTVSSLLGGKEPITADHISSVKDILMKLTVSEINGIKQKLGLKATGAKAELARKVAELALAKKPEEVKPPEKPSEPEKPELTPEEEPYDAELAEESPEEESAPENKPEKLGPVLPEISSESIRKMTPQEAYKAIRKAATSAGKEIRHGMGKAAELVGVQVGGVSFKWEKEGEKAALSSIIHIMQSKQQMPPTLANATKEVLFTTQRNSQDAYWEKAYGMANFKSAATGGDGSVVAYNGDKLGVGVLSHEAGHNLATKLWGSPTPKRNSPYGEAAGKEPPVSPYGANSPAEDFAEACKLYVTFPKQMKKEFPLKYKALKELLS